MEIPKGAKDCEFIKHTHFSLCYDEEHKQARWVAYKLTKEMIEGTTNKNKHYKIDPKVSTGSANEKDYLHSGYSKGHLAPAADFMFSQSAVDETFLYSNVSPQIQEGFNNQGGDWYTLEQRVREWVSKEDTLYVVTGPVLNNKLSKLPNSKVSIPKRFFKAILVYTPKSVKAIAFVIPHAPSKLRDIFTYAMQIDTLEEFMGFDLFSELPDDIEKSIESDIDFNAWHPSKPYVRKKPSGPCLRGQPKKESNQKLR